MKLLSIVLFLLISVLKSKAQEKPVLDTLIVGGVVFEKVEIEIGVSEMQWRQLLETNLIPVIKKATKKLKAGTYTTSVRFLKERNGSITDVKALNDLGYGLAEGAEKVVKSWPSGPKWAPGEVSRNSVRSYHTQLITFQIP